MAKPKSKKSMTYKQLKRAGSRIKPYADSDRDGVINKKDCRPFDPKKQGRLHDFAMARLRAKEQKLENARIRLTKKLETQRETLNMKRAVRNKKLSISQIRLKRKQVLIDEIKREKAKFQKLSLANKQAKRELFSHSAMGKASAASQKTLDATRVFLNKPSTKKAISRFNARVQYLIS